jgi:COP9 signalosome complex subunit 1
MHIMAVCPALAAEAFVLCVQHIHQSRDPALYQTLLQTYEQVANANANADVALPNPMELAELDTKWADEVLAKTTAERTKLEVELKTYTNNMIKESIRVRCSFEMVSFCNAEGSCRWRIAISAISTVPQATLALR